MEDVLNFPHRWKIVHLQKIFFLFQNHTNWNILQRWKFFHFGENYFSASRPSRLPNLSPIWGKWKFFHFGGKFSTSKFFFFLIAELHELEHSAEATFFRKIGKFSTFSKNSKIRKIYLFRPTTGQSLSRKYFLKKWASK